jgi:hypothetical protein
MNLDNRIIELLELARRYDFTVMLSSAAITQQLIDAGFVVDPDSGEIVGRNDFWFPLVTGALAGTVQRV